MNKPHKHATLIKAWADGAEIQFFTPETKQWRDFCSTAPAWLLDTEYRIKPKTIKYRVALFGYEDKHWPVAFTTDEDLTKYHTFIKWIGDWQEVVVE